MKKVINLKVRVLTVSCTLPNTKEVPQIRIQGIWLEKLGFTAGKKMIVEESHGKLVLKLVSFIEKSRDTCLKRMIYNIGNHATTLNAPFKITDAGALCFQKRA